MELIARAWTWLTDDHVVGTTPEVQRFFMRCESCGRIFRHYWGCKPKDEPGRIGCKCGNVKARIAQIPEWQAAALVVGCYVWRKLILKRRYWDPRMPSRKVALDA